MLEDLLVDSNAIKMNEVTVKLWCCANAGNFEKYFRIIRYSKILSS